jgi:mannan endo-1,4-beta-mannosidase
VPGTNPPRNVIYYSSNANSIPLGEISSLRYTDVIIAFLIPDPNGGFNLIGSGGAFDDNLKANIQTLKDAGKNVLIALGGGAGFPSSAWEYYAENVDGLVDQIVTNWVQEYGFSGVDIDYEDDAGFQGTYDGITFLVNLTKGLAQKLPSEQDIITHAPQTPYWDPAAAYNNAYTQIWQQAGSKITWINNQFYNNGGYDATPALKVEWYNKIAAVTGAQKLMVGTPVTAEDAGEGYIPLDQMISQVIQPLQATWGSAFGGVMGWEFASDPGGAWATGIGQALAGSGPQIIASLTARDPLASRNAQSVYAQLVAMENAARAGNSPMTIIGQHIEGQNELYNPGYGDTGGTTYVGYYYNKAAAITGKLPAFVEIDVGPGWGSANGWGIFNERSYDSSQNLPAAQKQWQYVDDAVDLAFGVWKGFPRADDGTYNYNGLAVNVDGSTSTTAPLANGGSAAGIVGSTFHQPYPGSARKDFSQVLDQVQGQSPGGSQYGYPPATISTDQNWFDQVVDWNDNTPQYQDLLADLSVLAGQLSYFAEYDIPVLFRPYHEMNTGSFWWGNKTTASYQGLWRIMYNYLVNTRGLHNLIFVWAPIAWTPDGGDVPWDYYPGSGYVDIVAVDDYNASYGTGKPTPETASFTNIYYTALAGYAKPRMLSETYSVPITSSTANGNYLTASPWVIWSIWGDYLTSSNSNADVKDSYYATEYVYTGGSGLDYGQNFNWGSVHAD